MQRAIRLLIVLGLAAPFLRSASAQFVQSVPTLSAGAANQPAETAILQSLLTAPYPKITLRAQDAITIKLYGVKDFDSAGMVNENGMITLPLIGDVPAAGLTTAELGKSIAARLSDLGMVKDPQVSVSTTSLPSSVVTVSGDIAKPGVFPAAGQLTLIDYISLAGGLAKQTGPQQAGTSSILTLVRPSLSAPVTIPLGSDPKSSPYARIPIFAGDEIRVSSMGVVYAVGAFRIQGSYPLKASSPTTVTELVALAGGAGFEGSTADAHIVRNSPNGRILIALDLSKILRGTVVDVALQRDDILFLPTNQMKAAIKGGGAGLIVGIATAAIYR